MTEQERICQMETEIETGNLFRGLYLMIEKQYETRPEAKKREFSQKLFSEIVGFKYPAVNSWIIGRRNPSPNVLSEVIEKLIHAGYELPENLSSIPTEQARAEIAERCEIKKQHRNSAVIQIYFSVMQQYIKRQNDLSTCTNFSKHTFSQIAGMDYVSVARWLRGQAPSERNLKLCSEFGSLSLIFFSDSFLES